MTIDEAIKDIQENIKPIIGGKSLDMAVEALELMKPYKGKENADKVDRLLKIDEAIKTLRECEISCIRGNKFPNISKEEREHNTKCAKEYAELVDWLKELRYYIRYQKQSMDAMNGVDYGI